MDISEIILIVLFFVSVLILIKARFGTFDTQFKMPPNTYVIEIPNFLPHSKCDSLARAASSKGFVASEVAGFKESDPAYLDLKSRKSNQTWFAPGDDPVADAFRNKTKRFLESNGLDFNIEYEDIQVAKYDKDGYYHHHFDGDDCDDACPRNQRIATMIVYLKEPEHGGETDFPELKKRVKPKKGSALFFWVADPTTRKLYKETLHAGMPVKKGEKIIATQWIRSK
jgi:prolyl 4-hydroxylase